MKSTETLLYHILDSICDIESYVQDLSFEQFLSDQKTQDAVMRRIQIIGEATKKIPESFKNMYLHIPWKPMMAMRDILVHVYFEVDYTILWHTVTKNLPAVKIEIERLIEK